jgi:hypothetical protein
VAYQITIESTPRYLHVRVTGENSRAAVLGYLAEVNRACAERRCTNVLIEEDLRGPSLDMLEIFRMVADRAGAPDVTPLRVAFVDVNPEHDTSRMQFAENVAVNRGLQLRVFARAAEAAAWL